jgi:hypothetical protein
MSSSDKKSLITGVLLVVLGIFIYIVYSSITRDWGPDFSWLIIGVGAVSVVASFMPDTKKDNQAKPQHKKSTAHTETAKSTEEVNDYEDDDI